MLTVSRRCRVLFVALALSLMSRAGHTQTPTIPTFDQWYVAWVNGTVRLAPQTAQLTSPASGAMVATPTVVLTWTAMGAQNYDVSFGTVSPPPIVTTATNRPTGPSWTTPPLVPGTTYYWRITARNPFASAPGSAIRSFTTPGGVPCTYTVTPNTATVGATGGTGTLSLVTTPTCPWTATSQASWLTVVAGGTGPGAVIVTATANPGPAARVGTVTVAGQIVTVTQDGTPPPCVFTVTPIAAAIGASGGTGTVSVTTPAGCAWTTTSNVIWLVVTAGTSGPGTVTYTAQTNPNPVTRTGTLTIAGQLVTVTQAAAAPVVVPPSAVTTFALPSATDTTLTVMWTEVSDGAGQPAKYDIRVFPPPMNWALASSAFVGTCAQPLTGTVIGAPRSCTIGSLTPNSNFDVQMAAYRGSSVTDPAIVWGPLSAVITGHTLPPAPPPTGRLNLQWDPGVAPPGMPVVTNYQARCGPSPGVYTTMVDAGLSLTASVPNLPLTTQYCAAFAFNGQWSPPSNEVSGVPTTPLARETGIGRLFIKIGRVLRGR